MKRLSVAAALLAALVGSSNMVPAQAAGVTVYGTATLTTTINVLNVCYFTTQSYTDTYNYDPIGANQTAATTAVPFTLNYQCTNGDKTDYFLFDGGQHSSATSPGRQAANGSNLIFYGIYSDSAGTALLTPTTHLAGQNGTGVLGTPLTTTAYVASPGGQNVISGTYTDVVNITVTP